MFSFLRKKLRPFSSGKYWDERYKTGGNSGAGSYGRLADYKAKTIGEICGEHQLETLIEFGCGDGNQASLLDVASYVGVDISQTAVDLCREKFAGNEAFRFFQSAETNRYSGQYDLVLSLDVLYHLIEDEVFDGYMNDLFDHAKDFCLIYASNTEDPTPEKHVRHREYTAWIEKNRPEWECIKIYDQPFPKTETSDGAKTSFAHFRLFRKIR